MSTFFITGASGNVGKLVVQSLLEQGHNVRAALQPGENLPAHTQLQTVHFDFTNPDTWQSALGDAGGVFLMRPPHIANIKRDMLPFLRFLKQQKVVQTVFMSVQGAEQNPWVPHHKVEQYLKQLNLPHSLVRPSFFMQNLSTTHLAEIRDERQLFIPAGSGRTNYIDTGDIASCIAKILLTLELHNQAYTVTGSRSYSCQEIADRLSTSLKISIVYRNPGPLRFLAYHKGKRKLGMSLVMLALYTIVKLGKGDITTTDTSRILGRPPKELDSFIMENRRLFAGE